MDQKKRSKDSVIKEQESLIDLLTTQLIDAKIKLFSRQENKKGVYYMNVPHNGDLKFVSNGTALVRFNS